MTPVDLRADGAARPLADVLDVAGIGIGPFNLSLAALLHRVPELSARFFEARPAFAWHAGLLFDHAKLQSPWLKDLVTLVDPTNPYSFPNYLAQHGRLSRWIVASYEHVPRREFNQYFQWVCRQLPCLQFSTPIDRLTFEGDRFVLWSGRRRHEARDVVLGVGQAPNIPDEALPYLGDTVFHGSEYLARRIRKQGRRIAVIGGGQTGAEIFYDLISDPRDLPAHVTWATRRDNFIPFDDSPFANELYVPGYTKVFFSLPAHVRDELIIKQKYSSDAILVSLLLEIYRKLYEFDYLTERRFSYRLLASRRLESLLPDGPGWIVATHGPGAREVTRADVVILATGYRFQAPPLLDAIAGRIEVDGQGRFVINEDFSIAWDGPSRHRIYAHNAALHTHGWVDPNFAGMAWRSATIINSLSRRTVYRLGEGDTAVDWGGDRLEDVASVSGPAEWQSAPQR